VAQPQEPVLTSSVLRETVRRDELADVLRAYAGEPATSNQDQTGEAAAFAEPATPYELYVVADGDTASGIAASFGIDLQYLLWANPHLRDGELLVSGNTLIVPAANGILHDVRYGETLSDISVRYGVTVGEIIGWPGNHIASADQVVEDQLVFVPGGQLPIAALAPAADPTDEPALVAAPADPAPVAAEQPAASTGLIWPVFGPISSYMDASHPLGIDIDLYNNPYAAVAAATSGTVTFAGGDSCCSYGLHVIVMSPDGIETHYAHFSSIAVSAGQQVSQGQTLGNAGCTGYCTGNHLHFEVIDNGVRVNPLSYLP
ncbi:MAG: M23 family metallopeptidase, partial [Chloroflexi bacterium]|nr:M23 family metallopeptidase [Chloroflexota bacterium]